MNMHNAKGQRKAIADSKPGILNLAFARLVYIDAKQWPS